MDVSGERTSARPPTLYDVAKAAGVSHQSVSRVVKGDQNVRPAMRERIEAAIVELRYKPNLAARSLATNRSHRIGALVYELLEAGPSKVMQAASIRAREAGYLLDIVSLDPDDEGGIDEAISLINQSQLAGLLAFTPTDGVVQALKRTTFTIPLSMESEASDWADEGGQRMGAAGVSLIVNHLADLGHSAFFNIGGPEGWLAARGRVRAYLDALELRGLRSVSEVTGDWSAQSGFARAMAMPLDVGITAVVAANDQTALGAISALETRGVRVPEDISVVGFDDIPESRFFRPPLTTVRLDFEQQGRSAVDRLLAKIDGTPPPAASGPILPELVVRSSSGPRP